MSDVLPTDIEEKIAKRVDHYGSRDAVLSEALEALAEKEYEEWERREVQKGLESKGSIPAEQVFAELRERAAKRQQ